MQLTLDDLWKASDPLAALLAMSDSDLDRVAAEIQGKTFVTDGITNVGYIEEGRDHWTYQPTRHLGQAYRLLKLLPPECQWMAESEIGWFADPSGRGDGWTWNMKIPIPPGRGQRNRDYRRFYVSESQAGSHARAVVVLAILGLLQSRKDGGGMSEGVELKFDCLEVYIHPRFPDWISFDIDNGTGYYNPGNKEIFVGRTDAIDLACRILEHFDVLPTKGEIEACDIIETLLQDEINRYDAAGKDVPEWFHQKRAAIDATIAKLRRLVGEE